MPKECSIYLVVQNPSTDQFPNIHAMENSLIYETETSHLTFSNVIVCTTSFHYLYINSNVFTHITFQEISVEQGGKLPAKQQHKADKISTQS